MPEMRPRPDAIDIMVLECSKDIIANAGKQAIVDMTIEDFETGSWRKKLADRDLDLGDMGFLTGILEGIKIRQVSDGDEPPADMIWIREIDGTLKVWKFGANITPK